MVLPQSVNDWLVARDFEFASAVIALTIYTSVQSPRTSGRGCRSIPKEQMEAARSSGFSYIRSMRYIICRRRCASRSLRSSTSS